MLSNFTVLSNFLAQYWVYFVVAVCPLSAYLLIRRYKRKWQATQHGNKTLLASDQRMVEAAIEAGLDSGPANYLRDYIVPDLGKLSHEGQTSRLWETRIGLIALIASPLSSAITGVGLQIPGLLDTVKFSFAVTSVGTAAAAILIFFGWEEKSIRKIELARKIRDEIWQFTAGACEYRGLPIGEAWGLLAHTLSDWLQEDITAAAKFAAKKAAASTQSKKDEGGED